MSPLFPFDFRLPTRIVFGPGRIGELGDLARVLGAGRLGAMRALVVSDAGVISAGHAEQGIASLEAAGISVALFDGVHENPTTEHVEAGLAVAKEFRPDLIVGLGGGSSMDCAKGINFLYSCGGRMQDYWGVGKATGDLLPMIAVPTTAGTGSETQSFALISDSQTHVKMACGDTRAAFRVALLDPELTLTQPPQVTALTGIDAIAHAVESAVSTKRSAISQVFSREAWRHLAPNFPRVLADPGDRLARAEMQIGACLAGIAIENSMLGAAHALANPLTAVYDVPHGLAVALMLPHVVRFNDGERSADYQTLLDVANSNGAPARHESGGEGLAHYIEAVRGEARLAGTLSEVGVERDRLPQLASSAAEQWTGKFNPREVGPQEMLMLYERAF
jgi:alcohol dehydrogenase